VTHLRFGYDFAQQLDHVPTSVTHLVLFNARDLDGSIIRLPSGVTHLAMYVESRLSVGQVSAGLELLAFFSSPLFEWRQAEQIWDRVWLEPGQPLTTEQLAEPETPSVFQWKKPAPLPPPLKRKRDEDEGGPSVKRA